MLAGLKVLDLSQFVPGPYATRMLADLGADVIKVEPPRGDPMRSWGYRGSDPLSPVYRTLNRGKRIVRLDLKDDAGRRVFNDLVGHADVLLESFRPGVMERLGADRKSLSRDNPSLIYCSLSGYGQNGPYRLVAGHDINYCAAAGMYDHGGISGKPTMMFPPIADHASAMLASHAVLAALYAREKTGQGRHLDVSIYEAMLAFRYVSNLSVTTDDFDIEPFLSGDAACYNLYETADGRYVTLGAVEPVFWQAFCEVMGESGWIERQHEAYPQEALIAEVQSRFLTASQQQWGEHFRDVDCCFEVVPVNETVLDHPQTVERRLTNGHDMAYPAWIDDRPAGPVPDPVEAEPGASLTWLNP